METAVSTTVRVEAAVEELHGGKDGGSREPLWVLPAGFEEHGISKDIEGLDEDAELLLGASELLAP